MPGDRGLGGNLMPAVNDREAEGGDPPCWAHLFDDEVGPDLDCGDGVVASPISTESRVADEGMVDLAALTRAASAQGAAWTHQSEDLNVNLLVFAVGEGVADHVNDEADVLLVGVTGAGAVTIDGAQQILSAGHAIVIPKGTNRGIQSVSDPFAYLSCHRRRAGLWPGRQR
jgi:quercetin dioxygenase-like cupin family protein